MCWNWTSARGQKRGKLTERTPPSPRRKSVFLFIIFFIAGSSFLNYPLSSGSPWISTYHDTHWKRQPSCQPRRPTSQPASAQLLGGRSHKTHILVMLHWEAPFLPVTPVLQSVANLTVFCANTAGLNRKPQHMIDLGIVCEIQDNREKHKHRHEFQSTDFQGV